MSALATLRRIAPRSYVSGVHVRALCKGVSPMKTGTEFYMSLYPEGSTDGGVQSRALNPSNPSNPTPTEASSPATKPVSIASDPTTRRQLRLGNIVPDFAADTTHGKWDSFHEWKKGKWAILFSHPADFTPVCTTEIGRLAIKYDELNGMDCKIATLSVDPVKSHEQ